MKIIKYQDNFINTEHINSIQYNGDTKEARIFMTQEYVYPFCAKMIQKTVDELRLWLANDEQGIFSI
jgi:hypothetical protein